MIYLKYHSIILTFFIQFRDSVTYVLKLVNEEAIDSRSSIKKLIIKYVQETNMMSKFCVSIRAKKSFKGKYYKHMMIDDD